MSLVSETLRTTLRLSAFGGVVGASTGAVAAAAITVAQLGHSDRLFDSNDRCWAHFPIVQRRMGIWCHNLKKWCTYGAFFGATHLPILYAMLHFAHLTLPRIDAP